MCDTTSFDPPADALPADGTPQRVPRPVDHHRPALNRVGLNGSPEPTVVRVVFASAYWKASSAKGHRGMRVIGRLATSRAQQPGIDRFRVSANTLRPGTRMKRDAPSTRGVSRGRS